MASRQSWKFEKKVRLRKAIFEPLGVKLISVAHLKALIILYWNLDRPVVWQRSYYGPHPLEKGYFTP